MPSFGPRIWVVAAALVGLALIVGLSVLLVGSIMEFVLVESLRRDHVSLRRYWGRRWRQGIRLFVFRVALGVVVLGSVAVVAVLFLVPVALGSATGLGPLVVVARLVLPILLLLAVGLGVINGFTTVFVVPIMVLEGGGIVAGWRRLWPTIVAQPWQYLLYAAMGFVLTIGGGLVVGIIVGIAVFVLLIPLGILAAVGFVLLSVITPLGVAVLGITGLLFGVAVLALVALVQVPVVTYLRYYALFVLGDIEPELDLIPERRTMVRADET